MILPVTLLFPQQTWVIFLYPITVIYEPKNDTQKFSTKLRDNLRRFARYGYHLYNLKNVKKTRGGTIFLVKLQA